MSNRVTTAEVKLIYDTTQTDLDVFIGVANALITKLLSDAGHSATILKEIERYLSAHFSCVMDPRAQSEGVAGISQGYEGQTGMGLDRTRYGQNAKLIDTSGILASYDAQSKSNQVEATIRML